MYIVSILHTCKVCKVNHFIGQWLNESKLKEMLFMKVHYVLSFLK